MAKLALSGEQKLTLEKFFANLKLFVIGSPGAYPDNLGFVLSQILGGEVSLASYTAADRPSSPTAGDIIFNTTTQEPEFWSGSAWIPIGPDGSGTVTNIATGTGLTGGPITTTGTVSLADTAVTPGAYTYASITVDQQGRLTSAASGVAPSTPTVATTYASGSAAADQTILVKASDGGPVIVKADAAATGALLKAQSSAAADLLSVSDNDGAYLAGNAADSGANYGVRTDAKTELTTTRAYLEVANNSIVQWKFHPFSGNGPTLEAATGAASYILGNGQLLIGRTNALDAFVDIQGSAVVIGGGAVNLRPYADVSQACGLSAYRWSEVNAKDYFVGPAGGAGLGSGSGVISIGNAVVLPTTNPTDGGVLYCEGGALKYRGSSGTVTPIAPA